MANEQAEFLKDLEPKDEADVFNQPLNPEPQQVETEETEEDAEQRAKNRRERRLMEKLQRERESNIALNARLQAEAEARAAVSRGSEERDFLKIIEPIYGTDPTDPKAVAATELLKKGMNALYESAVKDAEERARNSREEERNEEENRVAEEEDTLDDMMAELEDEHDIDFSDPATRKGFLSVLEKLSPKDREGNIIEYADPEAAYEVFESRRGKTTSRAKEIASRTMTPSGQSQPSKLQEDATWRELKNQGIF